jgi:hypothetical protein
MRAKLSNAVRKRFSLEMRRHLPSFGMVPGSAKNLYSLRVSSRLVFFVYLSITENADSFVVELAANENENFPWTEMPGMLETVSKAAYKSVWRFRISKMWGEPKPYSWTLGTEKDAQSLLEDVRNKTYLVPEEFDSKMNEVESKVLDSIDKLLEYGVPYFELSAKRHNQDLHIAAR